MHIYVCVSYKYAFPCFHANLFEIRNINGTRTCIVKIRKKRVKIFVCFHKFGLKIPNRWDTFIPILNLRFTPIYIKAFYLRIGFNSRVRLLHAFIMMYIRVHVIISLDVLYAFRMYIYYGCRYTSPLMLFVYLHLYAGYIGIICIFNINEWIFVCSNTDKLKYLGNKEFSCSI